VAERTHGSALGGPLQPRDAHGRRTERRGVDVPRARGRSHLTEGVISPALHGTVREHGARERVAGGDIDDAGSQAADRDGLGALGPESERSVTELPLFAVTPALDRARRKQCARVVLALGGNALNAGAEP
jgi:hypothetical protein